MKYMINQHLSNLEKGREEMIRSSYLDFSNQQDGVVCQNVVGVVDMIVFLFIDHVRLLVLLKLSKALVPINFR